MLKRFLSYYRPYWLLLILDMFCVLLASAIDLAFPQLLRFMTTDLFFRPRSEMLDMLFTLTAALLLMYVVRYVAMYFTGAWGHIMGARMEKDMRRDLFQQYQKLSFSYYDRNNTGELLSRLVTDLFDITELAHHGPETALIAGTKIVGSFVLLLFLNVKLTLIIFAVTAAMAVFTFIQNGKLRKIFRDNRKKIAEVNAGVVDALAGIRVVKSYRNEALENRKFDRRNQAFLASKEESYRALGKLHSGNALLQGVLYLVILGCGGWMVASGELRGGELAIYALYVGIFLSPLDMLLHFTEQFQRAMSGFRRFDELMSLTPDIVEKKDAVTLPQISGKVEYRNVKFSYNAGQEVLHGVSLELAPGTTVALVGASGGGKSTICSLLPRFYDVSGGGVFIDGVDVRDLKLDFLRKHIGIVQQDLYLFNGTIRENIAYGKPDAEFDEIVSAAKKADIHDFIASLPDGYDSEVGEHGVRLSGGQKQRISIARVFLKDPEILLLDEATSALDNESERKIQRALIELARGRTTLLIAHRLSTVTHADKIVVIADGNVAESGTHDELMAKEGIYARLSRA